MFLKRKTEKPLPTGPVDYPNGSFVETEKGYFYLVKPNKRYRVISERVLESYRPLRVIKTSEAALVKYRIGGRLKFRSGSLIYNISDGKMFLVEDGKRRWITTPDALYRLGAEFKDVVVVSKQETDLHEMGENYN